MEAGSSRPPLRVLILGGTGEGMALASALRHDARFDPLYSLAGATRAPEPPGIEHRTGGFGGAAGLADWLRERGIEALVDATHPYALRISENAVAAASDTGIPLLRIGREAWVARPDDRWIAVDDAAGAAGALGEQPRQVLLTIGSKSLAPFRAATQHRYLVRCIDPPDLLPPHATLLLARGPFSLADERALLARHGIDVLVTKNSGGDATAPKLQAAREAGLPVVMIRRPDRVCGAAQVPDAAAALEWLAHQATVVPRGAPRGA